MENKAPTIKEIAKRLNISVSTVSRALHDHPSIGLRTKTNVQKLAAELGYEPNMSALSLKHGKTYNIGVIIPNLREEFFSKAISGIEDHAMAHDYSVLIGQTHDDPVREQKVLQAFLRHRVDGLIISLTKHTSDLTKFRELAAIHFPMVFFDRVPTGENFHTVNSNMYDATRQAIEYLFEKGHKRIALINGPKEMISSLQRFEMYKTAMQKRRLKIDMQLVVSSDFSKEGTYAAMEELLSLKNKPTAVLITNDYVALDAIQYAKKHNIKINEDLIFVSYANTPITYYIEDHPIASVEQYPYKQAQRATEILFDHMDRKTKGLDITYVHESVEPCLIETDKIR
ncbi:MAG TPA: LacI family DNA-binding transcriptional regulator [Phnomibacter sp.]|nr:LacI family DNA-binding transcriptional regulator [Phnomibacter sp.]